MYTRGWSRDDIRELVRLIDWFLQLPKEIESLVEKEIEAFEQEKQMPYVTSFERLGMERGMKRGVQQGMERGKAEGRREGEAAGLKTGIALALKTKFGSAGSGLIARVKRMNDLEKLRAVADKLATATTIDEVRAACVAGNRRKAATGQ